MGDVGDYICCTGAISRGSSISPRNPCACRLRYSSCRRLRSMCAIRREAAGGVSEINLAISQLMLMAILRFGQTAVRKYPIQRKKNQQHRIGQNKPRGMIEYRHVRYGADALQNRNAEYYRKNQQPASNAVALLPGVPQPLHRPLHLRYTSPRFFPVYHAVIDKPSDLTII